MGIAYVTEGAAELAREMEKKFQRLAPQAGVVFVGVKPIPIDGGKVRTFEVRLGISRRLDESTGMALVRKVLEDETKMGLEITAAIYRGVSGAARDEDSQDAHPTQA